MNSIKANEGYDEIEAFNSSLVPSEIKSSGIIGIGSEYSFEEWKSFLQSKGVNATDQEFQAFWDDWGADEDMEKSQFEESKTTETTESEKATEIKEEYSEYAYKQWLNQLLDENGELLVHGRHFRGADDLEENDNPAFREGYNQWLDDLEREGTNTGVNESKATELSSKIEDMKYDDEPMRFGDGHGISADPLYPESEKASEVSAEEEEVATDLWIALSEGGLLGDYINGGIFKFEITYPSWVSDITDTTSISWDELSATDKQNVVNHFGGVEGMKEKLCDEGWDNYCYGEESKASELATTIEDMKYDDEPMRFGDGHGISADPLYPESTKKEEPKLDTEEAIDNYIKEGTDPAPYEEEDMPESIKSELKEEGKERSRADIQAMKDLGAGDFAGDIPDDMSVDQWLGGDDNEDKDEADEILAGLAINDELEGIKDTYGSSPNADPTTTPLEDHSGTDDSSDTQTDTVDAQQETSDMSGDTVEESFGDCGCKDTKKARTTWESAKEGDKQYWLRDMGEDEGYSYYHFEHLPKRVGESLVDKFKIEQSEDRGWSKIPALERANLLKKLGFPPRDAELVANLEYPQLSESLKKDVNDAVGVKKRAEESKREKPDEQLSFENDLYSNMYDGYLQRRGERVDSKKNDKF